MDSGTCPTCLRDITVCEQQQGEWMDHRRVSDENVPTGLDCGEEGQPATGELFLSSTTQKEDVTFTYALCKSTPAVVRLECTQTCSLMSGEAALVH